MKIHVGTLVILGCYIPLIQGKNKGHSIVHLIYKCTKFQLDYRLFLTSLGWPKGLGHTQTYRKKRVPRVQKGRFSINEKTTPGIHPIHKCVKFQYD